MLISLSIDGKGFGSISVYNKIWQSSKDEPMNVESIANEEWINCFGNMY